MKTFLAITISVDMLAKKWIDASNETMLSCDKDIFAYNINWSMPEV